MTNKEKYKQAFSALHASEFISLEENTMKKTNMKFHMKPVLAACLCAAMLIGGSTVAYAADVGGIQEKIHVWINGKEADVNVVLLGGRAYEYHYEEDGESRVTAGGGIAMGRDGSKRKLSPSEAAAQFSSDVIKKDDGSVWLYDYDKSYDITKYMGSGACKVAIEQDGEKVYFDIEDNHGGNYAFSRAIDPDGPVSGYIELK